MQRGEGGDGGVMIYILGLLAVCFDKNASYILDSRNKSYQ